MDQIINKPTTSSPNFKLIQSLKKENEILKQKNIILHNHFKENKSQMECIIFDYQFKEDKYKATISDLNDQIYEIQHSQLNSLNAQIKQLHKENKQYLSDKDDYINKIQQLNLKIFKQEQEIKQSKLQNAATNLLLSEKQHNITELNINLNDKNKTIDCLTQEIKLKRLCNSKRKALMYGNTTIRINNLSSILPMSPNERMSFYSTISADIYEGQPVLLKRHKSESYCYSPNAQLRMINSDSVHSTLSMSKKCLTNPTPQNHMKRAIQIENEMDIMGHYEK